METCIKINMFISVDIDNYHNKCCIIISFKLQEWFWSKVKVLINNSKTSGFMCSEILGELFTGHWQMIIYHLHVLMTQSEDRRSGAYLSTRLWVWGQCIWRLCTPCKLPWCISEECLRISLWKIKKHSENSNNDNNNKVIIIIKRI